MEIGITVTIKKCDGEIITSWVLLTMLCGKRRYMFIHYLVIFILGVVVAVEHYILFVLDYYLVYFICIAYLTTNVDRLFGFEYKWRDTEKTRPKWQAKGLKEQMKSHTPARALMHLKRRAWCSTDTHKPRRDERSDLCLTSFEPAKLWTLNCHWSWVL